MKKRSTEGIWSEEAAEGPGAGAASGASPASNDLISTRGHNGFILNCSVLDMSLVLAPPALVADSSRAEPALSASAAAGAALVAVGPCSAARQKATTRRCDRFTGNCIVLEKSGAMDQRGTARRYGAGRNARDCMDTPDVVNDGAPVRLWLRCKATRQHVLL